MFEIHFSRGARNVTLLISGVLRSVKKEYSGTFWAAQARASVGERGKRRAKVESSTKTVSFMFSSCRSRARCRRCVIFVAVPLPETRGRRRKSRAVDLGAGFCCILSSVRFPRAGKLLPSCFRTAPEPRSRRRRARPCRLSHFLTSAAAHRLDHFSAAARFYPSARL